MTVHKFHRILHDEVHMTSTSLSPAKTEAGTERYQYPFCRFNVKGPYLPRWRM
jgi:hypothetical protein